MLLERDGEDQFYRSYEKWKKYYLESRSRGISYMSHILLRNYVLRQVIEGKIKGGIEVTGRRGRRRRKLLNDLYGKERILTSEGGSSKLHYVESWPWKSLWTCRETDC
jgi:hypothetical protein